MAVTIGEVEVQSQEPDNVVWPAPTRPVPRIDPDQLRMIIRREQDRRARLWVDCILDPMETRGAIITSLEAASLNPDVPEFKVGVLQT